MKSTVICFIGLIQRGKRQFFNLRNYIPSIRDRINRELNNINSSFEKDALQRLQNIPFVVKLPDDGMEPDEILKQVQQSIQLGRKIKIKNMLLSMTLIEKCTICIFVQVITTGRMGKYPVLCIQSTLNCRI